MRSNKFMHHDTTGEFELDLAPLLAVMVKLVPVLLVSSAFVQLMIIETELPQVVQEAVQNNDKNADVHVAMEVDPKVGIRIVVTEKDGKDQETVVPLNGGAYDYATLHQKLVALKTAHPSVFKIDLRPAAGVEYGELVKVMDEARRARDSKLTFPVPGGAPGQETRTPYMFPEIVFANSLEG